jgi:hypothetical protein
MRKERETAISLMQTTARYAVWAIALALCFAASFGQSGTQAVIGMSFLAIVVGFAAQRVLIDLPRRGQPAGSRHPRSSGRLSMRAPRSRVGRAVSQLREGCSR